LTGYDVIDELAKSPETGLIPFIFLSALADREKVRQGMELGADDYLTKPFKIRELLRAVEVRLRKKEIINQNIANNNNNRDDEKLQEVGHIFLEVKYKPLLVKVNTIVCITAYVDYSNVFLNDGSKILVRRLLKKWEEILPQKSFIRIHRSTIINLNYVEKV